MDKKLIVGLIEMVHINGYPIKAKIDSGSSRSSISLSVASKLKLGPIVKTVRVVSSHGKQVRPVVKSVLNIKGREMNVYFSITERRKMKYDVLIGLDVLKNGFLIDPRKDENSDN